VSSSRRARRLRSVVRVAVSRGDRGATRGSRATCDRPPGTGLTDRTVVDHVARSPERPRPGRPQGSVVAEYARLLADGRRRRRLEAPHRRSSWSSGVRVVARASAHAERESGFHRQPSFHEVTGSLRCSTFPVWGSNPCNTQASAESRLHASPTPEGKPRRALVPAVASTNSRCPRRRPHSHQVCRALHQGRAQPFMPTPCQQTARDPAGRIHVDKH
jgi:hypothetical protein